MKDKVEKGQAAAEEVIDKTPIAADENVLGQEDDGFGGFDDEEDEKYMEKAKRNAMRRRGLDPKALDKGKADGKTNGKAVDKTVVEKPETETGTNEKPAEKSNGKVATAKVGSGGKTNGKSKSKSKSKKKA